MMITYKLYKNPITNQECSVSKLIDNVQVLSIPFAPDNTDYQQFKKDLANGVALQDANGATMSAADITTFLQGLK